MENRPLIELYRILKDTIEEGGLYQSNCRGMCLVIDILVKNNQMTLEEGNLLYFDLLSKKPNCNNEFKSFTTEPIWGGGVYWWGWMRDSEKFVEVRLRFLEAVINSLK